MKAFFNFILFPVLLTVSFTSLTMSLPHTALPAKENFTSQAGFYMPDSVHEVSLRYRSTNNLIVLPVTINDSVHVNLILDTGCRNIVLFGKRFNKLFKILPQQKVQFSGLGEGQPVFGGISLNNKVAIGAVLGEKIPIVVVPNKNLFSTYTKIHGVIGYEIFLKFEIELNPNLQRITFRPAVSSQLPDGYTHVPIRIEDSRPLIDCEVIFSAEHTHLCNLMIDTGSSLGLLLKTTTYKAYEGMVQMPLGRGFNGEIEGVKTKTQKLLLGPLEIKGIETGIIYSPWHSYASIGMDILKEYSLILNYYKGYAGFRKV